MDRDDSIIPQENPASTVGQFLPFRLDFRKVVYLFKKKNSDDVPVVFPVCVEDNGRYYFLYQHNAEECRFDLENSDFFVSRWKSDDSRDYPNANGYKFFYVSPRDALYANIKSNEKLKNLIPDDLTPIGQARKLLEEIRKLKKTHRNDKLKVGLTYSSNFDQTMGIRRRGSLYPVSGGGQATVISIIQELITSEYSDCKNNFDILPITTSLHAGGIGKTSFEILEDDLQHISRFVKEGGIALGWQSEPLSDDFAIGGGYSGEDVYTPAQSTFVQTNLQNFQKGQFDIEKTRGCRPEATNRVAIDLRTSFTTAVQTGNFAAALDIYETGKKVEQLDKVVKTVVKKEGSIKQATDNNGVSFFLDGLRQYQLKIIRLIKNVADIDLTNDKKVNEFFIIRNQILQDVVAAKTLINLMINVDKKIKYPAGQGKILSQYINARLYEVTSNTELSMIFICDLCNRLLANQMLAENERQIIQGLKTQLISLHRKQTTLECYKNFLYTAFEENKEIFGKEGGELTSIQELFKESVQLCYRIRIYESVEPILDDEKSELTNLPEYIRGEISEEFKKIEKFSHPKNSEGHTGNDDTTNKHTAASPMAVTHTASGFSDLPKRNSDLSQVTASTPSPSTPVIQKRQEFTEPENDTDEPEIIVVSEQVSPEDNTQLTNNFKQLLELSSFYSVLQKHEGLRELSSENPALLESFLSTCDAKKTLGQGWAAFYKYVKRDSEIQELYVLGRKYKASRSIVDFNNINNFIAEKILKYQTQEQTTIIQNSYPDIPENMTRSELLARYKTLR